MFRSYQMFLLLAYCIISSEVWAFSAPQHLRRSSRLKPLKAVPDLSIFQNANDLDLGTLSFGGLSVDTKYATGAALAVFTLILPSQVLIPKQLLYSKRLAQIVDGTFLSKKDLECVYKGSRDGWSAINFHDKVDGKGSAVVVCRTRSGKVFGGYNPSGWRSTDDYYDSNTAFLWAVAGSAGVKKYPVLAGGNAAIFDYATGGPCFGSADMLIGPPRAAIMGGFAGPDMENTAANAGDLRQAKVTPGITYSVDQAWPVFGSPSLLEVEVYCNAG